MAKRKAWNERAVALVRSSPAENAMRSISPSAGSLSRATGLGGLRTSLSGLTLITPYSRRATFSTEDINCISRITPPGATSFNRLSRHVAKI
jgi:hypothetical protein